MQLNHSKTSPGSKTSPSSTGTTTRRDPNICPWMGNIPKCPRKGQSLLWTALQVLSSIYPEVQPGRAEQDLCPGWAAVKDFRECLCPARTRCCSGIMHRNRKKSINCSPMYHSSLKPVLPIFSSPRFPDPVPYQHHLPKTTWHFLSSRDWVEFLCYGQKHHPLSFGFL